MIAVEFGGAVFELDGVLFRRALSEDAAMEIAWLEAVAHPHATASMAMPASRRYSLWSWSIA